ncbi:MAG: hypothetical protein NVS4B8_23750 [Herpetosiphon sp.]
MARQWKEEAQNMFLMWYDDDKRKSTTAKIEEALAAYEQKFHATANVVLVNTSVVELGSAAVQVRPLSYIQPSMFYVGIDEESSAAQTRS